MNKIEQKEIKEENPNIISNDQKEEINNNDSKIKLFHKYSFWFLISQGTLKNNQYESKNKKIAEFDTIEDFWKIYQHIKKPDNCQEGIELKMFKDNIEPRWDDDSNKNGGKLILLCNKEYTSIIWEEIILNIIGNIFPKNIVDNINGIVFISKSKYNTIQIWFKQYNENYCKDLEQCLRNIIQIPNEVPIKFKKIEETIINKNHRYYKNNNYKHPGYTFNKYKNNKNYYN